MVASKTDAYIRDNAKQISESKATTVAKKVEPEFKITHLIRQAAHMESIEEVASMAEEQSAINEDGDLTEKLFYSLKLNVETLTIEEEDDRAEILDETVENEVEKT